MTGWCFGAVQSAGGVELESPAAEIDEQCCGVKSQEFSSGCVECEMSNLKAKCWGDSWMLESGLWEDLYTEVTGGPVVFKAVSLDEIPLGQQGPGP